MSTPNWHQVKRIFSEALALPPEQRAAFIASACPDADIRTEVLSLLASFEDAPEFLESAINTEAFRAIEAKDNASWVGQQIGPYHLEQILGKGGMGLVYLASRKDGQFDQQVALKIGKQDTYNQEFINRLLHERQVLASLSHPNIARLLDGGMTEQGQPYFAMEYVEEGLSITEYSEQHGLSIRDRLHLFQSACDAVAYAHRQLVVHRDIKPSNILVSPSKQVKLLDFGLAKLLDEDQYSQAPITRTGVRVMTLEYASPEQVRGKQISTASDIYSAGIVLYELLTGKRPYSLHGLSPTEVEHIVCDVDPPRPSTSPYKQPATNTNPPGWERSLRGDLDTIVMKALIKEPERRYGSIDQLKEDINRYLNDLPISARPVTARYRFAKFVRRHQIAVGAVVLIMIALLAGIFSTSYQASIAQQEREIAEQRTDEVRAMANSLLLDLHDAVRDLPGATPARRLLVQNAEQYLQSLSDDLPSDLSLRAELAEAYKRVGEIQGDPHYPNLGDLSGASSYYEKALALRESLWLHDSTDAPSRHAYALALGRLAVVYSWGGSNDEAISLSHKAITQLERILAKQAKPAMQQDLGRIRSELGWWYVFGGHMSHAKKQLAQAREELEALSPSRSGLVSYEIDLWRAYNYSVDAYRWSDAESEALEILEKTACPRLEALIQGLAINPRLRSGYSTCLNKTGDLYYNKEMYDKALGYFELALEITEWMAATDSTNKLGLVGVSRMLSKLGNVHTQMGNTAIAARYYDQSINIKKALFDADPENGEAGNTLGITLKQACLFNAAHNRLVQALDHCTAAKDVLEKLTARNTQDGIWQSNLIESYLALARVYALRGTKTDNTQSIHWYTKGIQLIEQLDAEERAYSWPDSLENLIRARDLLSEELPG